MAKKKGKKVDPQERAEPGSGEKHDKHAEKPENEAGPKAEPGSGEKHDKHAEPPHADDENGGIVPEHE